VINIVTGNGSAGLQRRAGLPPATILTDTTTGTSTVSLASGPVDRAQMIPV